MKKRIEAFYRARLDVRCDDVGNVFYFSAADFPGLLQEPFGFRTARGHRLQGYFYSYPDAISNRLVVFDHGMGGGHRSYMKEIELLARHGYRVFAYDHTGCMESEGESTGGFGRSVADLDDCLRALKVHPEYRGLPISVVGHSWGAFACMNIVARHPDVRHVVAMSGFISVDAILCQFFGGLLAPFRRHIRAIEAAANPSSMELDARTSLADTSAEVLLIYSLDDKTVHARRHLKPLKKALSHRDNIRFLEVDGKDHNPNYTREAVMLKNTLFRDLTQKIKGGELATEEQKKAFRESWDWNAVTEQDPAVWTEIFACLDKGF